MKSTWSARATAALVIMGLSYAIGMPLARGLGLRPLQVMGIVGVLLVGGTTVGLIYLRGRRVREEEALASPVASISTSEAEALALRLMQDEDSFRVRPAESALVTTLDLPGSVRRLFDIYDLIEARRGDLVLSRAHLGASTVQRQFVRIGEGAEHIEYAVRPGDERVFELEHDAEIEEPYATVFHLLVEMNERLHRG